MRAMASRTSLVLLLLVALASATPASADTPGSHPSQMLPADAAWDSVRKIAQGVEIQVEPTRGSSVRGRFVSASDASLSLYVDRRIFEVGRDTIRRIHAVEHRSRSRVALKGAGIGLGSGVGVGLLVVAGGDRTSGANFAPVALGFVGTIAGTVVGALRGGKRKGALLYERR
jgi:hypothetical protein